MRNLGKTVLAISLVAGLLLGGGVPAAWANTYASGLKVSGESITSCTAAGVTYILNENADGDPGVTIKVRKASDDTIIRTVTFTGTLETQKGTHTFVWDKKDDSNVLVPDLTSYYFDVATNALGHTNVPWFQISDDGANTNKYFSPRGVVVNRNPGSYEVYGRIYVSNSLAGQVTGGPTLGDGIYVRNADSSDSALGQGSTALTGGVNWTLSASGPFRLAIGADDQLYITDYSNAHGGLWVADKDVNTAAQVLEGVGGGTGFENTVHSAITSVRPFGTLAGADLKIYTMDQNHGGSGKFYSVWRYDVGAGPLPWNTQPNQEITSYVYTFPYTGTLTGTYTSTFITNFEGVGSGDDMDIAPDGKVFVCQQRSSGNQSGLLVFSADNGTGQSTILYDSLYDTRNNILQSTTAADILANVVSIAVSPDGTKVAVLAGAQVIMVPLFQSGPNQGLPDLANRVTAVDTFAAAGRQICWDAVGNIYVVSNGTARLRIYSPPDGPNTSTTRSRVFTLNGVGTGGPAIDNHPQSAQVCLNAPVSFTVGVSGSPTFQWLRNGNEIPGATSNTLNLTADGVNAATGDVYTVAVCDSTGVTVSQGAVLTIFGPPTITQNPSSQVVYVGGSATFTGGGASGAVPNTVSYQWYKAPSTALSGQTASSLAFNNIVAGDGGSYFVRATDTCGRTVDSWTAMLAVLAKPCTDPYADADSDGDVDMDDFGVFQACYSGTQAPLGGLSGDCGCFDRGGTAGAVDDSDFAAFKACAGGPEIAPDVSCDGEGALFVEDFDSDHTANWTVNKAVVNANDAGNIAEFFYDYSQLGIPSAPRSGGTTRGLRLRANSVAPPAAVTLTGLSVSPTGQSFTGDFTIRFDAWLNFNGPLSTGTTGSTQITEFGFGTAATGSQLPGALGGAPVDSVFFACNGDAPGGADYRVYDPAHAASYQDGTVVYVAGAASGGFGNRNARHPYYNQFFGGALENNAAPAAQLALFPQQTGITRGGAQGFRWRDMRIVKSGDWAVWYIDGHPIATVDLTQSGGLGGSNILFGQSDIDGVTVPAGQQELMFGLIDNIAVSR